MYQNYISDINLSPNSLGVQVSDFVLSANTISVTNSIVPLGEYQAANVYNITPTPDNVYSGFGSFIELEDVGNCVCSVKYGFSVDIEFRRALFMVRYETNGDLPSSISFTDTSLDLYPSLRWLDTHTVDSTPRVEGNRVYFGFIFVSPYWTAVNDLLFGPMALKQHVRHEPFNQPQK